MYGHDHILPLITYRNFPPSNPAALRGMPKRKYRGAYRLFRDPESGHLISQTGTRYERDSNGALHRVNPPRLSRAAKRAAKAARK